MVCLSARVSNSTDGSRVEAGSAAPGESVRVAEAHPHRTPLAVLIELHLHRIPVRALATGRAEQRQRRIAAGLGRWDTGGTVGATMLSATASPSALKTRTSRASRLCSRSMASAGRVMRAALAPAGTVSVARQAKSDGVGVSAAIASADIAPTDSEPAISQAAKWSRVFMGSPPGVCWLRPLAAWARSNPPPASARPRQ